MNDHSQNVPSRAYWQEKSAYYHRARQRYIRNLVPEGSQVLEIGSGLGDLLASLRPARGVGLEWDRSLVEAAGERHKGLEFQLFDGQISDLGEAFDYIILSDVIAEHDDIQALLSDLSALCHARTRLIIGYFNMLWMPVLKAAEWARLKRPQQAMNWLSTTDVSNLLHLAGFETVKTDRRMLLPKKIPILSTFANRFFAAFPGIRLFCLDFYVVARLLPPKRLAPLKVSIVIPCRNEKGHIEDGLRRLPRFGDAQEIIFVDGHSEDDTPGEIERMIEALPDRDIKLLVQEGRGKGDAVRMGFAHASGDLLMILDADLTVPPEDLPKFYEAAILGKGEFINGSRLVYPMESQAMRTLNIMGNKFFAMAFSWLLDQRLKDTLCGTKVLFKQDYQRIAEGRKYFGDFDPFGDFDLLFGASRLNLKIVEVPIRYRDRAYGTTNISRFRHGWLLLKMTVYAFFKLKAR